MEGGFLIVPEGDTDKWGGERSSHCMLSSKATALERMDLGADDRSFSNLTFPHPVALDDEF